MKIIFFLVLIGVLGGCGKNPQVQTLLLTREGNGALKKQNYAAAIDRYVEALRYDPFLAELHLNMGLAFEGLQQPEKAQQAYAQAEKLAVSPDVQFMALFNQAQLLGKAKKKDEAIALYQRALEIDPTSREAKTNIELLTQDEQGGGGGEGDKKDDDKDKNKQNDKDKKQDKKNDDKKDDKDKKDKDKKDKDKDKDPKDPNEKKQYQNSPKYQPRKFDSKDLSEGDVKKILEELRQQEQKIRADFNRKEVKEQPRDKDW